MQSDNKKKLNILLNKEVHRFLNYPKVSLKPYSVNRTGPPPSFWIFVWYGYVEPTQPVHQDRNPARALSCRKGTVQDFGVAGPVGPQTVF